MQNVKREAIEKEVWRIVDRLPQRDAILDSDARAWVAEVVARYGDLALWHATRAGGFGGSQIGVLVRNHLGQRGDHGQSAHDLVEGALLRRLPDEPKGPMRRGVAMEPQHRSWFYEKYQAERDVEGFTRLSRGTGPRAWMRYSPDDLVFIPVEKMRRRRMLIDFKAPTEVEARESVAFQYVCQLHMGRLVCESNDVAVDGLVLSQLDWANWQLKDDEVPHVPELDGLIQAAGDLYWHEYVLRGRVPPYVSKPKLDAQAVPEGVRVTAARLARLKALCTAIEKRAEEADSEVKAALSKLQFGTNALALDGITFTASCAPDMAKIRACVPEELLARVPLSGRSTKRYDEDGLVRKLRELGGQPADFLVPANLDSESLYAALADGGFDADSLMGESIRSRVDKNLGQEAQAWVERELHYLLSNEEPAGTEVDGSPNSRDANSTQRCVPRLVTA